MDKFFEKYKGKYIRYWIHKIRWTPYELDCKDPNQSTLESEECNFGYITEVYNLGYDWLIGISEEINSDYISFYKLSELDIAYTGFDQED